MLRSSAISYFHADGLGSVTSLSSSAGAIANTYTYDSFGKLTASTGSLVNPFQYTARESDSETGLYYYRARYYDPSLGRFLNEDPLRFAGGENFYRYVGNNPVTRKDSLGLWQVTIGGGAGLGALLTFGNNSGQYNFGIYSGVGEGGFIDYDPKDSGGCHRFGGYASLKAHVGVGVGPAYATVDSTQEHRSDPTGEVEVKFPAVGGFRWDPTKPHEPPHGFLGIGEGVFAGIGLIFHSAPNECDCKEE
jgi:RHS repeat-associated protein